MTSIAFLFFLQMVSVDIVNTKCHSNLRREFNFLLRGDFCETVKHRLVTLLFF